MLLEGVEKDDYRSLFYGFLILADLSYPMPRSLKNYAQYVKWAQDLKALLAGQPEFSRLAARTLETSIGMQESAHSKDRKKFRKLLEIVIVTVNNLLATSQDGTLVSDSLYAASTLSTRARAIEDHQRLVLQLAEANYF